MTCTTNSKASLISYCCVLRIGFRTSRIDIRVVHGSAGPSGTHSTAALAGDVASCRVFVAPDPVLHCQREGLLRTVSRQAEDCTIF